MSRNENKKSLLNNNFLAMSALLLLIGVSVTRIHLRVENTLTGYTLGKLKANEQQLLEERSFLKMQHAKLTTKKHLELMATSSETGKDLQKLAANP
jgi:hypothetical protein